MYRSRIGARALGTAAVLAIALLAQNALAAVTVNTTGDITTIGFTNITNNNPSNVDVASQLSVDVQKATISDGGAYTNAAAIQFTFKVTGSIASRISQIYFDDGRYLREPKLLEQGSGTNFEFGSNPDHPPGIDPNDWTTTSTLYSADQSGNAENGIDNFVGPGTQEYVTVTYRLRTLADGDYQETKQQGNQIVNVGDPDPAHNVSYEEALAALLHGDVQNDPLAPFRIALHVTGIGVTGKSDTFMIDPIPGTGGTGGDVPEPATLAMWGLGLGIAGLVRLGRRKK